ncbi:hypothetical protein KY329_00500 [Candidatus Woesearchaeota archaeon]|nr:hypothetical protein [Candidatus Woesearchaeota archaeon]
MKYASLFFILLILVGCGECKTAADCPQKTAYQASCVDGDCQYVPLPNVCGNMQCEAGENKCTCPEDCGQCTGRVGQYMVQTCVGKECIPNVDPALQKPIADFAEARSAAGVFNVETIYNNPFNFKRNKFYFTAKLASASATDIKIVEAVLKATTQDRRTIQLAQKRIDRQIWENYPVEESLILDIPTTEGKLQSPTLELKIEYLSGSTLREATITVRLRTELDYVNPDIQYPCLDCDDNNPATSDICGPNNFCIYEPIPGTCGNYICEAGENKCTCPKDCGPCTGSAGNYLDYACKESECVGVLKPGVQVAPNSIFDERRLGPIKLNNKYEFNNPFDVSTDKIKVVFSVYDIGDASNLKIETIRVMEQNQLVAEQQVNKALTNELTVEIPVTNIVGVEEEKTLSLSIWYTYDQNGERKGDFTKSLGRITLIKT